MPLDATPYLTAFAEVHSPSSASSARLWVPKFLTFLGNEPLTAGSLVAWCDSLKKEYAPASQRKATATVKGYLRYLRLRGELTIDSELVSLALRSDDIPYRLPEVLEPEEIRKLCSAAAKSPTGIFLALGLLSGLRPGECLRVVPEHFRPNLGIVCYATKTKRERVVPTKDSVALQKIVAHPWPAGKRLCDGFSIFAWEKFTKATLGREVNRKTLRSTHATYLASSDTITEYAYASRMGHSATVGSNFYRIRREGVKGSTVEEWCGAADELRGLADRLCS